MSESPAKTMRAAWIEWRRLDAVERMSAVAVPAMFGVVFLVALWLQPDARGFGTHQQLGMRPCTFEAVLHIPCPTCGMTTAFALMARGRVVEAFFCQPAGAGLFAGGVMASVAGLVAGILGRQPSCLGRAFAHKGLWAIGLALLAAAWIYKVVQAL